MPVALGSYTFPTLGDVVHGAEATLGNVVEGIIEGVSGQQVELTPGVGTDNTRATGPRGGGEIRFDRKLATHEDLERLRKEVQGKLRDLTKDVAKLRVQVEASRHVQVPAHRPSLVSGSMNPLMLLLLTQQSNGALTQNPLLMMLLMQSMQTMSVGSVGGQPVNVDLGQLALMQLVLNSLTKVKPVIQPGPDTPP